MAMPPFQAFMRPVLEVLSDGSEPRVSDLRGRVLAQADLSDEDLAETMRGGGNRANSRVHWAVEYLAQARAVERPRRGVVRITDLGRELLAQNPDSVSIATLRPLEGFQDWDRRSREGAARRRLAAAGQGGIDELDSSPADESPLEQLIAAVDVLERHTATLVVERLREQPPEFLERAVLKLLHAMGYGGSETAGEHLGRSHDGGIDGVIRQDALGIERVYLQAKRYKKDNTVGSAAIREFVGALTGVGASGGVFITTSDFSVDARKYVERLNPRVILINGDELGRLMVQYEVGVAVAQVIRVTELDENFFDD
jgi:restriction system protein